MSDRPKIPRQESLMMPLVRNPFVHKLDLTVGDKIRIAICTVTLFPIRLILILMFLLIAWLLALVALLGIKDELKEPLSGWRRFLRDYPYYFALRAMFFASGFHWLRYKGQKAPSHEAPIAAVAPHSTYTDPLAVFFALSIPTGVGRIETDSTPFVGTLVRILQPVFVSRNDPNSRQNTIKEIKRRAQSGGKWPQVIIFPEGTCTNRSCLISFKGGAFYPGVAVQPVVLRYLTVPDTVTWTWEGPGAYKVLWLTLCNLNNKLEVEFLPVYKPSEEEIKDPKLFARNVRAVMAEALNVPVTDHTYEDTRLMLQATKTGLPLSAGLVEFQKIRTKLGVTFDSVGNLLDKYAEIAKSDSDEGIDLEDFARYLDLPVSPALKEMFQLYDRDGTGKIDFREYIIGCSLLTQPANSEETIQLAFQMFDEGDKGYISQQELTQILHNAFGMTDTDVAKLFHNIDQEDSGKITYEQFKSYAEKKPEYAMLFKTYQQMNAVKEATNEQQQQGDKVKAE
ncbi:lysophosphatidylcholine acyltransferase 2-like isoform X1 [Ptychodera flava]|uniref:lysophosphatidylcholine acyltransferase 2-like isoform X1 n=1 Tax=Ptychodera flava TaxID=63121 RepID=UPI00396A13B7